MSQTTWDPLRELANVQQRMNKLFETALVNTNYDAEGGVGAWTPVSDVYETSGRIVFCLELPGLDQKNIDVKVETDELVVQGERKMEKEKAGEQYHRVERSYGRFLRRFRLPSAVDRGSVEATYRDGVLEISLAKKGESEPKSFRVAVR